MKRLWWFKYFNHDSCWYLCLCSSCCTVGVMFLRSPSQLLSVLCQIYFFHFTRILNGLWWWNLCEVITATNRWVDYILGEIRTGKREQDTTEHLNRHQLVLQDVKRKNSQISLYSWQMQSWKQFYVNLKTLFTNFV